MADQKEPSMWDQILTFDMTKRAQAQVNDPRLNTRPSPKPENQYEKLRTK